jgi:LPXTG-motif cell wall-anchored protein
METTILVRVAAGILFVVILGVMIARRKKKAV